ncbi:MAG: hypothetical protein VZR11_07165 [Succinimonas sp.]|nr:hypothetical protein [Succinimonas sp.]
MLTTVRKIFINVGLTPEELTYVNGLKTAFKNSLNSMSETMSPEIKSKLELKLSFVDAFMDEIKNHMRTGSNHTGIINPDAVPPKEMQENTDQLVRLTVLKEDKDFNENLDKAVSELGMKAPSSRNLARLILRDLVFCSLAKNKEAMVHYKAVIADVTNRMKNDESFMNLLSVDAMTEDHLKEVVNKIASKEVMNKSYQEELNSTKSKDVTPTTIHKIFLRDTLGSTIKIGNTDLSKFHGEENIKAGAEEAFSKMVPKDFRGFVSSFMMQGGLPNVFFRNLLDPETKQEDRIHPLIPDSVKLLDSKYCLQVLTESKLTINKRDEDTLEIRTVVDLNGCPSKSFDGIDNRYYINNGINGVYKLKSFEMVHTINLKAGVETVNGIPNIPKDMKLESLTVKDTLLPSNIDF